MAPPSERERNHAVPPPAAGAGGPPPGMGGAPFSDEPVGHVEADLLGGVRQLILAGKRSGEGYFSPDGRWMVFQAEREPGNPFYQIYLLDRKTGDVQRVSPGHGKTTCAWIHPGGRKVLFASTHADPDTMAKMRAENEFRASGQERRQGAWDYDEHYDLYETHVGSGEYTRLTDWQGYTAEGSWSPDGALIAFASNRRGFEGGLPAEDASKFAEDPSYLMDIYVMDASGADVRRLTDTRGYDGGPFFSPDGRRIVWRRFNAEGTVAEIWSMNVDGSDQRPLTRLGVMSWAPFYHPSGDYIVFTTNRHGFGNFELYMVDAEGLREPVRVTFTDGPDVLPVFRPDGREIVWVTRRTDGNPHLHIARWNDAKARELLGLAPAPAAQDPIGGASIGVAAAPYDPDEAREIVARLASDEMAGRMTGTPGETLATEFVMGRFRELGLEPEGDEGYFQPFTFTSGVSLEGANMLVAESADGSRRTAEIDADWRPLAFSRPGGFDFANVAFAGYGIVAPAEGDQPAYDAYADLDVKDKWVVVLRYVPDGVAPERRQYLSRYGTLRYKAMEARDRGAAGIVVVTGPHSPVKEQLVPLRFDGTVAGASIGAVSVSDGLVAEWFGACGRDLATVQAELDRGEPLAGFDLEGTRLGARISLRFDESVGRNVIARLRVGTERSAQALVLGAHVDHLGRGERGNTLARADEEGQVHPGADDNASGVAGLLGIARRLATRRSAGELAGMQRDIVFAAWSGEELGLLGSGHYAKAVDGDGGGLAKSVAACINLDMIGRMERSLIVQGVGSSPAWREAIERANVVAGLPLSLSDDTYLPTDATSFYLKGVPILAAFTGTYSEHHSPRDRPEILDYDGIARIAAFVESLLVAVSSTDDAPAYVRVEAPKGGRSRSSRVYLGTIPDFSQTSGGGVLLGGVSAGGPAQVAGLQAGDRIVELAGQPIDNIYEYMKVMDALKIGEAVSIAVVRAAERLDLSVTPGSRD